MNDGQSAFEPGVTGHILGIGIDLIDIRRIANSLERFGAQFKDRIFTQDEQVFCDKKPDSAAAYARQYAVKEACSKALGTGISRGVFWRDMSIVRVAGERPELIVTGGAKARLSAMTPKGHRGVLLVSISDEPPYATAIVTASAVPI